jgi:NADPH:quinone reductase-like Zn-dependent oxidoreductase
VAPKEVFENLVTYIERGEIRPLVARTYRLSELQEAQTEFAKKRFVGKIVIKVAD